MDILATQAAELFDSSSICQEGTPSPNFRIRLLDIHGSECEIAKTTSSDLENLLKERAHLGDPKVRLVTVPIENDGKLAITAPVLKRLVVEQLKIDPCILWFIARRYDGFHRIDNATSTTYIIATSIYMIACKHDRDQGTTVGLLFERGVWGFYDSVTRLLESFASQAQYPALVPFIICQSTCDFFDRRVEERTLHHIHSLESITSFGPGKSDIPLHRYKTEQIMVWLRMLADTHINLSNILRMSSTVSTVVNDLVNNPSWDSASTNGTKDMGSVVRLLESRIKALESYLGYLKDRAEQMSHVIFALLTHEDAAISTDMAKSSHELAEHSSYLAERAKQDSSAMKTITIITMAFLPGTFFATLFALPTLDWEGPTIVTNKFWVYWAFTLPSTALVFILWLCFTNKVEIMTTAARLIRSQKEKNG